MLTVVRRNLLFSASKVTLTIGEKTLDRVNTSKYLGVIINENLSQTWSDHVEYLRSKVLQRLGLQRRI